MSQPPTGEEPEVVPGWSDAPVTGDRVDVSTDPIIAGDPDGARVEVTGDGLHAYDGTGTETATIQGKGGAFVGGSFRTSDQLPGQVTISDNAYLSSGGGTARPGIRIDPEDDRGVTIPAGIGPYGKGLSIDGGRNDSGRYTRMVADGDFLAAESRGDHVGAPVSYLHARTESVALGYAEGVGPDWEVHNTIGADQDQAWVDGPAGSVFSGQVGSRVSYYRNDTQYGWIDAYPLWSEVSYTSGNTTRSIRVDDHGVWVKTGDKSYNLEETAQDSGWQSITLGSGLTGGWSPAWRNKGGVIYMRGRVTRATDWSAGWNVIATLDAVARPASHIQRAGVTREAGATFLEVTTAGAFQVWFDEAAPGSTTVELSPMFYPLG